MPQRFEYQFVRLGEKAGLFACHMVSAEAQQQYQAVIRQYAQEGWRLVQVFAPGLAIDGQAAFYELIFERPVPEVHA
jgi:hypothetical protein